MNSDPISDPISLQGTGPALSVSYVKPVNFIGCWNTSQYVCPIHGAGVSKVAFHTTTSGEIAKFCTRCFADLTTKHTEVYAEALKKIIPQVTDMQPEVKANQETSV